jgi:MSHA biogenesis protein MshN
LQTERGDLPAAASTLQTTLPAAADKAEYRALYAAVLQRAGRHAEATEHYAAALKLTPGNGVWWMGLGISLEAEGRIAEARQAFQSARAGGNLAPELAAYVEQRLRELQ